MPISFSNLLLNLQGTAEHCAFIAVDDEQVRLRFARSRRTCFHLVLAGEITVTLHHSGERRLLRTGDLALFIHGDGHDLGSEAAPPQTLAPMLFTAGDEAASLEFGHPATRLLSGYLGLDDMGDAAVSGMPTILVRSFAGGAALGGVFGAEGLADFLGQCRGPGGRAVAAVYVRMLHLLTMREALERLVGEDAANLRRLGISQLGAVRRLIHADPGRPWTLVEMARSVGMSRSIFARKFHDLIGETPHRYLAGIRLERARQLIDAGATLSEASSQVGYASAAALARAYRRRRGESPVHRRVRNQPEPEGAMK